MRGEVRPRLSLLDWKSADKLEVSVVPRSIAVHTTKLVESDVETVAEVVHEVALVEVPQQMHTILVLDRQKLSIHVASWNNNVPCEGEIGQGCPHAERNHGTFVDDDH